jgi:hypothetical protein
MSGEVPPCAARPDLSGQCCLFGAGEADILAESGQIWRRTGESWPDAGFFWLELARIG